MVVMQHHAIKNVREDRFVLSEEQSQLARLIVEMELLLELSFYLEDVMMEIKILQMDVIDVLHNPYGHVPF